MKKKLNKIYKFIKKYFIIIKNYLVYNKEFLILGFSLFILDFSLRAYYYDTIKFYKIYKFMPNYFSIMWIFLILGLLKTLKGKKGKIVYIISYIISLVLFLTHSIYFSYFNTYFDFGTLKIAGEGMEYMDTILTNIKPWILMIALISVISSIHGLRNLQNNGKANIKKLCIVIISFLFLNLTAPYLYGNKSTSVEWSDWRNPRIIYDSFNDNNKSMMVSGMYEYTLRNIYVNFFRDNQSVTEEEQKLLEKNFEENTLSASNKYTGIFKDKDLIIIQLESIDDFLVTKDIMPTLYKLKQNSLNFSNHYSFTSGGGSTFNSEFMVNTGYSTAYNYNEGAYLLSRNNYSYSLPNLLKNEGYNVNAFHMNTKEFYSRGVNYKSFGYSNYYGLKDLGTYKDNSYWLDTELLKNEKFNNLIFDNVGLSMSYIITYSAHMPFSSEKGTCSLLTDKEGLSEYDCLKLQARETDNFIKLLLENLEQRGKLDNTVLAIFSDHYLYTLEDKSLLDKFKTTDNNLINKTPFIIYNNGNIKENIKDVNSQLDILPTLLNLFGIDYYTNFYLGQDILSNDYMPIVYFSDGSWYNGSTYVYNGENIIGKKISKKNINKMNDYVKSKMNLNNAVLKSNYFEIVDKKIKDEQKLLEDQNNEIDNKEIKG